MLVFINNIQDIKYGSLMGVYEQELQAAARRDYPHLPPSAALFEAQQDFYAYLKDVFFKTEGTLLAVWQMEGEYASALRLEPYEDGYLLCGICTALACRRQGYARSLLTGTLARLPEGTKIYSHVEKYNQASIELHRSCGFENIQDGVKMLNGSFLHNFFGFLYGK